MCVATTQAHCHGKRDKELDNEHGTRLWARAPLCLRFETKVLHVEILETFHLDTSLATTPNFKSTLIRTKTTR